MGRRKGEDGIASRGRRMPYLAKIKRDDPFRPEDEREIEVMCRRIAAASALAWGLSTGAACAIAQAYRQARDRRESELTASAGAAMGGC